LNGSAFDNAPCGTPPGIHYIGERSRLQQALIAGISVLVGVG